MKRCKHEGAELLAIAPEHATYGCPVCRKTWRGPRPSEALFCREQAPGPVARKAQAPEPAREVEEFPAAVKWTLLLLGAALFFALSRGCS